MVWTEFELIENLGFGLYRMRFDDITNIEMKFMIWGSKLIDGDIFGVDGEIIGYSFNNCIRSRLNFRFQYWVKISQLSIYKFLWHSVRKSRTSGNEITGIIRTLISQLINWLIWDIIWLCVMDSFLDWAWLIGCLL